MKELVLQHFNSMCKYTCIYFLSFNSMCIFLSHVCFYSMCTCVSHAKDKFSSLCNGQVFLILKEIAQHITSVKPQLLVFTVPFFFDKRSLLRCSWWPKQKSFCRTKSRIMTLDSRTVTIIQKELSQNVKSEHFIFCKHSYLTGFEYFSQRPPQ